MVSGDGEEGGSLHKGWLKVESREALGGGKLGGQHLGESDRGQSKEQPGGCQGRALATGLDRWLHPSRFAEG